MRFYSVEPPTTEAQGDGEDVREWFATLAEARRRFREIVREIKHYDRLNKRVSQLEYGTDEWEEANDAAVEACPGYVHDLVTISAVDVPTTKMALLSLLRGRLLGSVIEQYP